MTAIPSYHRDVYFGEPIESLQVNEGDTFWLQFNVFDDEGTRFPNGYDANIYVFQSRKDQFSGSGAYFFAVSGSGVSGTSMIYFDNTTTNLPGEYKGEIVMTSGTVEMTAGEMGFTVIGD